jgi:hypothetical protein
MIAAIAVFTMVFAAGAVLFEYSSNVNAEGAEPTAEIIGETNLVKVGGTITYKVLFFEPKDFNTLDITYVATFKDSGGTTAGSVSPGAGSLTNGIESTLTITAPRDAGKYTLSVTFTERIDDKPAEKIVRTQTVTVAMPITLSAALFNNSTVDFTDFTVYFHVDGKLVDESKTLVTVAAGERTTVTYEWVVESLSNGKHTFKVVAGQENIGDTDNIIVGGEGTFYLGGSDYGLINILIGVLLVVVIIATIFFYRKQVKNYGKPKSRR